jgi:hypothetical protein
MRELVGFLHKPSLPGVRDRAVRWRVDRAAVGEQGRTAWEIGELIRLGAERAEVEDRPGSGSLGTTCRDAGGRTRAVAPCSLDR